MKYIEIDEELYRYIAGKTEHIGESASAILRRLLGLKNAEGDAQYHNQHVTISEPSLESSSVAATETLAEVDDTQMIDKVSQHLDEQQLAVQKGAVGRFLFILEAVYLAAPERFSQVLEIQGRDRLYFARSKEQLLNASRSANPKQIGQSGFWVITNNNTAKKRALLSEVLRQYGTVEGQINSIIERV